jgi:hypothetical protein
VFFCRPLQQGNDFLRRCGLQGSRYGLKEKALQHPLAAHKTEHIDSRAPNILTLDLNRVGLRAVCGRIRAPPHHEAERAAAVAGLCVVRLAPDLASLIRTSCY